LKRHWRGRVCEEQEKTGMKHLGVCRWLKTISGSVSSKSQGLSS
jgi:hypothetical protein